MAASGSVEVDLTYGGHFSTTAQGDLLLAVDSINDWPATTQRLIRLILTRATRYNAAGTPISRPDDLFNPTYGVGLGTLVGSNVTPALFSAIAASIQKGIAGDPGIATQPAPVINITDLGGGQIQIDVTVVTVTGQTLVVPPQVLSVLAAT